MMILEQYQFEWRLISIAFFNQKKIEIRAEDLNAFLNSLVSETDDIIIDKNSAMAISSVRACVELISNTIASIPVFLYRYKGEEVEKVEDDERVKLLNNETGDILTSFEMKQQFVKDYLLDGNGYIFVNRKGNKVKSLHYIDNTYISYNKGDDAIFKSATISVQSQNYNEFDFIRLLNNTTDGVTGHGIVQLNKDILKAAYHLMRLELNLMKSGGNRKGFLKMKNGKMLTKEALESIKNSWRKLYMNKTNGPEVLNDGIEFQEISSTPVELQINEIKKNIFNEICNILNTPSAMFGNSINEDIERLFLKSCILHILNKFESTLNRTLLLENEKPEYKFSFDIKKLLKGDIQKQFAAYQTALQSNFMQIDEIRKELDLKPIGFNYLKLQLSDVLFDVKKNCVYTANTNELTDLNNAPNLNQDNQERSEGVESVKSGIS